ncbi:MAG: DMT family transporter [Roseibium sp.]|uniref:DMT family transporter n=1 Tax=Roseibium sp. TaxID=1936156 RepID=UPI0026078E92|nr:DMT family transporter [Roseibium sp.]MCV0427013.1 DMT family transporter [Roseibium sp.]
MTLHTLSHSDRTAFGIRAIVCAVFLMAAQDALIKLLSGGPTLWQIWTIRGVIVVPLFAGLAALSNGRIQWREIFSFWVLVRSLFLAAMYVALYAVLPVLPLASAAAGYYTGPLFITVLSAFLIGEKVSGHGWAAVAVGFAGTLILLQPGTATFQMQMLAPVLSGFLYALAAMLTRTRCRETSILTLAVSLNVVLMFAGAGISLLLLIVKPVSGTNLGGPTQFLLGSWADLGAPDFLLIVVLAVLMLGIGIGLAAAYQSAAPAIIAPFDYSYLIFAALFGLLLFQDIPSFATMAGMLLIAGGGYLATRAA